MLAMLVGATVAAAFRLFRLRRSRRPQPQLQSRLPIRSPVHMVLQIRLLSRPQLLQLQMQ